MFLLMEKLTFFRHRYIHHGRCGQNIFVNFNECKSRLCMAPGTNVLLLDCCAAAAAASGLNGNPGNLEILAACGFEGETQDGRGEVQSFTQHLAKELQRSAHVGGGITTIAQLNAKMVEEAWNTNLSATPWHGYWGPHYTSTVLRPRVSLGTAYQGLRARNARALKQLRKSSGSSLCRGLMQKVVLKG